ncbi:hypothetical protein DFH27DRAFT_576685 [Peziza echinospora]|nr:hypothetical protein DFH27DRAFT_576685 [Peziza echinospora]
MRRHIALQLSLSNFFVYLCFMLCLVGGAWVGDHQEVIVLLFLSSISFCLFLNKPGRALGIFLFFFSFRKDIQFSIT